MKIIDLLNKIANGEINEDTLIEFGNGNKDYCSVKVFFDRYIMDRENLNCEVEMIEDKPFKEKVEEIYNRYIDYIYNKDDKKIERLQWCNIKGDSTKAQLLELRENTILQFDKINEIIDEINKEKQCLNFGQEKEQ